MKKFCLILLLFASVIVNGQAYTTLFEKTNGRQTPSYPQIIDWWKKLDEGSGKIKMLPMGMTDAGYPLHLIVVSANGDSDFKAIKKKNKRVILINNGIHPGEPDGIDASMLLARDIVINKIKLPDNIVLAIIPVYNIGGCLNRSKNYRVDQNGPDEFGFRGNSQNLDLNRDFIKSDSREARSFAEIFHLTDPDVFVDNHVSDGADYQHIMTLICTQHDKLGGAMGEFMINNFEPGMYSLMKSKGYDLVPYVNDFDDKPETGWAEFYDSPRYSSGYAALWNSFSFIPETHMLKPYNDRVLSTYALMKSFIEFTSNNSDKINALRNQAKESVKTQSEFQLNWLLDKSQFKLITFKGFESGYKASEVSGLPRLYYDRNKPFELQVKLFNHYTSKLSVKKPAAYIIPQGWWKITELLNANHVVMNPLKKDTTIEVEVYHIESYKSTQRQYEMHHPNSEVVVTTVKKQIPFRKGDLVIPMNQEANRFITETLEPQSEDSYFSWNYFDAVLGQKEWYSSYSFEDIAAAYLKDNPALKLRLDEKRKSDSAFAKNGSAQLAFVFQNSVYAEPDFMQYPVYRLVK